MKAPLPTEELRYDMSQFSSLKGALEELLGHRVYLRLKETATLSDWKAEAKKLLRAIKLSVKSSIKIADDDWFVDVDGILEHGERGVTSCNSITALFAILAATLTRLVFLQIGFLPLGRQQTETIPLKKGYWTLDKVRTVQYVQNDEQRQAAQMLRERRTGSIRVGDANANGQILVEKTGQQSSNHRFATVWIVRCPRHGTYKANSCDFHIRKCPHEGGEPGLT